MVATVTSVLSQAAGSPHTWSLLRLTPLNLATILVYPLTWLTAFFTMG